MLWKKVLVSLKSDHIPKHGIAKSLKLPVVEIENLLFGLTIMRSIDGHGVRQGKGRANLGLVNN
jgi:hypothetical protein